MSKESRKVVLITGSNGGIGQCLVENLLDRGYLVISTDVFSFDREISSKFSSNYLGHIQLNLISLVRDSGYAKDALNAIVELVAENHLFGLVNNAAVQILKPFVECSNQDWLESLEVNLMAPVTLSRILLPYLEVSRGSIVNISSIHSSLTKPFFSTYSTSKAALSGLTRAMAVELGNKVRVNCVEPAAIATPMLESGFSQFPELKVELENFHPTGTIGTPADVANAALFLLDSRNCFLNGCVLPLGGGIHSRLHDPV